MPQTIEQQNGQGGSGVEVHPNRGAGTAPGDTQGGGRSVPDSTKVDIDRDHRLMIEDWADWYYPGLKPKDRPSLDVLLAEMIDVAHGIGANDKQRPETPGERKTRLKGGQS